MKFAMEFLFLEKLIRFFLIILSGVFLNVNTNQFLTPLSAYLIAFLLVRLDLCSNSQVTTGSKAVAL